MSVLLYASGAGLPREASDWRINREDYKPERPFADVSFIAGGTFANGWWPRGGLMGNDGDILAAATWGEFDQTAGAASRYGFTGITRDQYGSVLGSCVVKLFRTSDDKLIDTTTSNATTGAFLLNTPYYPDTHYIYVHKTGSPDVDGVSPNTMIGS